MKKNLILLLSGISFSIQLAAQSLPGISNISQNWKLQDAAKVSQPGTVISKQDFQPKNWYVATVPGTILTTLVNNGVYPEPLYGENNRPDKIPESLNKTSYWYRTVFNVPAAYAGKRVWLNFDGINYTAEVWVNGKNAGDIKGAFSRGNFDITSLVTAGKPATLAVLVSPQPNPGNPHEHTINHGMGKNGGITAIDGPTFLCSIGWDWIPAIRDRNTGIWQKVYLSASGPVLIKDPLLTSDVAIPGLKTADITVQTTLQNTTNSTKKGVLKGYFGNIFFEKRVEIPANSAKQLTFDPKEFTQLHITNPSLWWPNGYGPQNLYNVKLSFEVDNKVSDATSFKFGIRKITYTVPDTNNLTLSVNGVRVLCKGGDWGMDEAMKRIPRERLDAEIRMHKQANYTIIRNWVGQSTGEDFYELCDKYGMLLWDEFFQPNPSDGPNPSNITLYLANVREKILRYRNHASIAVWCARNEGFPPKNIDDSLREIMKKLEPVRLYQASSTDGRGVNSGGPYFWRSPEQYYDFGEAFKTEIGSMSIPTLESIHGMMPRKDWEVINDDWAEHDFANGAQAGNDYRKIIGQRYGKVINLADFVRKGQLANYEAFRAMYEGRNAKLFKPSTGVITWMSNPAQPSFVWQLYHHDLEPNSSLFAVREACEPLHIQLNEKNGHLQVINNFGTSLNGAKASSAIYDLSGALIASQTYPVNAEASRATDLGLLQLPQINSNIYFVKLKLWDANGKQLSENFYWRAIANQPDNLQDLNNMPVVKLDVKVKQQDKADSCLLTVTLHNPTSQIALMSHLQLRQQGTNLRVLPVYYSDNYISLVPGESRVITIEAAKKDMNGKQPLILADGWNITVPEATFGNIKIAVNKEALVSSWPETDLPIYFGPAVGKVKINCGGQGAGDFSADNYYSPGNNPVVTSDTVKLISPMSGPEALYQSAREAKIVEYVVPVKPLTSGKTYTVQLHWAETKYNESGRRTFNVDINDKRYFSDIDIFKEAGGKDISVVKQITGIVPDDNGTIDIHLAPGQKGMPFINGIEVF